MVKNDSQHDPLEQLAEEYLARIRSGEEVCVEEYAGRFPQLAEAIREVFPAMEAMESAKPQQLVAPELPAFDALAKGQMRTLGDFRIIRKIAQGGMGIVYEAEEVSLARRVAIKVLPVNLIGDALSLERFHREAKAIARLHHTNIVSVFGAGREKDLHFFVMQFIDGRSLERIIRSGDYAMDFLNDWNWIADATRRLALALNHAHQQKILHRDVKPGNILIDVERKPWMTDFGLAKLGEHEDLTRPGDAVGTLRYMAPEQTAGQHDERSDVYGLGLVMYEMLVGQKVYEDSRSSGLLERLHQRDLTRPGKLNRDIPVDLEMICWKAIAREPADRYQNALELAEDLERYQKDLPISARKLSSLERLRRWAKRNPVVATLTGLILTLLVGLCIALGSVFNAWLRESSARLDAGLARSRAEESRRAAENSVDQAMEILDHFAADLAVFHRIESGNAQVQSFLFSPLGGLPVSERTRVELDLINRFYQSVGQHGDQRTKVRFRRYLALVRSSEIALQLREYDKATRQLNQVQTELRNSQSTELVTLWLYAGDLIGYAHLQSGELELAKACFESQLQAIEELNLDADTARIERGKALLGRGLVAHSSGNVRQWHDSVVSAIGEFEQLIDWEDPNRNQIAAIFLARCYLNIPPQFRLPGYAMFHQRCHVNALRILHALHSRQVELAAKDGSVSPFLFFYDYCNAAASLPRVIERVNLINGQPETGVPSLLRQLITECEKIVSENGQVPAFRFALARCEMSLANRNRSEFELWTAKAKEQMELLVSSFPDDTLFLTELGDIHLMVGNYYLANREFERAQAEYQKSVGKLESSLEKSRSYPRTQMLLPQAHEKLALVFDELNDNKRASYHRNQVQALRKSFPQHGPQQGPQHGPQQRRRPLIPFLPF